MKYYIKSFYNEDDDTVDDKKYAHYYLALISIILPYLEEDSIITNYKELVDKLVEDFGLEDNTTYSDMSNIALELANSLYKLDIRLIDNQAFIDLYQPSKLRVFCTLVKDNSEYTPNEYQDIINTRFLHYNKLLTVPTGYTDMYFEQNIE